MQANTRKGKQGFSALVTYLQLKYEIYFKRKIQNWSFLVTYLQLKYEIYFKRKIQNWSLCLFVVQKNREGVQTFCCQAQSKILDMKSKPMLPTQKPMQYKKLLANHVPPKNREQV
jgi:hypothetical protein